MFHNRHPSVDSYWLCNESISFTVCYLSLNFLHLTNEQGLNITQIITWSNLRHFQVDGVLRYDLVDTRERVGVDHSHTFVHVVFAVLAVGPLSGCFVLQRRLTAPQFLSSFDCKITRIQLVSSQPAFSFLPKIPTFKLIQDYLSFSVHFNEEFLRANLHIV